MQAEIITIGDEILIGQIVDSNSAYIASKLDGVGLSVQQITSIQDDKESIVTALGQAGERAKVIVVTGGLGPTKDDMTKEALCTFFGDRLVEDADVLHHLERLFADRFKIPISEMNRAQALVPSRAKVLHNRLGTAPGLMMKKGDTSYFFLPGVPYEMRSLIKGQVLDLIRETYDRPHIFHKTILTAGLGESAVAEKIQAWEEGLPPQIKLAYLPKRGSVRLRLSSRGLDADSLAAAVEAEADKLYPLIGEYIYGDLREGGLVRQLGKFMGERNLTLAAAESFSGGRIAKRITAYPGASQYFKGSLVSYATQVKTDLLGIPPEIIAEHSVVSAQVAVAMAERARKLMGADYGVSTTGNAGPGKGDSNAPVGTVYIGISGPKGTEAHKFEFGGPRKRVVRKSVDKVFELLYREIINF